MNKFDLFRFMLKPGIDAAKRDCTYFRKWEEKKITMQQCKYFFKNNNRIPRNTYELISDSLFEEWLNSLGYRRSE